MKRSNGDIVKERNHDKWWFKASIGFFLAILNVSVGMTVYVFTTFPTKIWAEEKHEQIVTRIESEIAHQREINELKLDFIKDSIGKSAEEIERNREKLDKEIKKKEERSKG